MRAALAGVLCLLAGQGWAGEAWLAEYEVRDHDSSRTLVVVRSEARVEYREDNDAPARLWRRLDDGIERIEVFAGHGAMVVASPGDLRTLDELPEWDALTGILPPARRAELPASGRVRRLGMQATRHVGPGADGGRVVLEWLDAVGLPARYHHGGYRLRLRALERVDADAFTPLAGLRAYDRADLGDMPLDPFARHYLERYGRHRHAH